MTVQTVIGFQEHAWMADLSDAPLKFGGDDADTMLSSHKDGARRMQRCRRRTPGREWMTPV
jgi:hypothetical protein